MEKFIGFFLNRKLIVYLLTVLIIIAGVSSLFSFKREMVPETNFPWIEINISGGSLPPEEMEEKVTKPIEKELRSIATIEEYNSSSWTGGVSISVQAQEGKGEEATQEVQTAVNRLRNSFPSVIKNVNVVQANYGDDFLMELALCGNDLPVLFNLANTVMKDRIEAVENVKRVDISADNVGNKICLTLHPEEIALYQLTPADVIAQLQAANVKQAIGTLKNEGFDTVIEIDNSFKTIQQIGDVAIQTKTGQVALRQLADIQDLRGKSADAVYLKNGVPYIFLNISKAADCDMIKTAAAVYQVIDQLNRESQGQYTLDVIMDGSTFIKTSVSNLSHNVLIGAVLAILILFVFLRNWRVTMVISTTIPLSVFMTFIGMNFAGYNLDLVTLLSLSLSVGLMVDAAIVVLESIYFFREKGESLRKSIILGTREVVTPVLTSQLTIVTVFLPLMIVGLGGVEYKPIMETIAFTVTVAIVSSTIAALIFVPVYANSFLMKDRHVQATESSLDARITSFFSRLLALALRHRIKVVLLTVGLFVMAIMLAPLVKTSTDLEVDESYIQARLILPKGSNLGETDQAANEARMKLKDIPEIKDIYTDAQKGNATIHIITKDKKEKKRSREEILENINANLAALHDVERFEVGFGGGANNTPVELEIVGKDMEVIRQLDDQVQQMLKTVPNVRNPRSDFEEGVDKITLVPQTAEMERLGVSDHSLMQQLAAMIGEQNITTMTLNDVDIDVVAQLPEQWMQHPEQLRRVLVKADSGAMVPLADLVQWKFSKTPNQINHKDGERIISVKAELAGGDMGAAGRAIEEKMAALSLPEGYTVKLAGALEQQKQNMADVVRTFLGTIALIYIIMVAQFGRLSHPLIIMLSLPMAIVGVVVGLVITQRVVNPIGMVGFIMLIGIVVSNAILLIDRINLLRSRGYDLHTAIMEGARNRVRPILMTKLTAILALTPLALAFSEGSDLEAPMATIVIFGLIFHTLITLVLLPVLYSLFESLHIWWAKKRNKGKPPEEPAQIQV
ncbi:efflux RND transporter permease subunit [Candidatus Formimonas warabiya]|uniref:Transporter n=1 Tax=Formimonas warabiya TaxID=1761012 RepID=A0A3G1KWL3_FORW1|nr:efflux RND transporter permease subunit [Candidatus Formimonas warabiya]ATW26595.1 transporter [Candidatus Formimonas warabiya]